MTLSTDKQQLNPYDELPYCDVPIEWTSPERLALASLLHGGPRLNLGRYRVLELGCANGANLLPLAWYRQQAEFVGIDASTRQISLANQSKEQLGLKNLRYIHADFRSASEQLDGEFDIIMAHGVFSWVSDEVRDAMLELCVARLAPDGLLYQNYNAKPGWQVRGMVRDFLLHQTRCAKSLKERAEMCREISARVVAPLKDGEHSYTKLMANEFQLVVNNRPAYIAHEYLSPENNAYWRSEFFAILEQFGFAYVADADFNCISNRITTELASHLVDANLAPHAADDSADLLCYRQMQSPILTKAPLEIRWCDNKEFSELYIASNLIPVEIEKGAPLKFGQPSGQEIEISDDAICTAMIDLQAQWPRGRRISALFADIEKSRKTMEHMLHHELIELRCIEPGDFDVSAQRLNELEQTLHGFSTSAWHKFNE